MKDTRRREPRPHLPHPPHRLTCPTRPIPRLRPNGPGRRVVDDRRSVTARHQQTALERHRRHRDHAVAAHRAVALVVHEQHAGVGARQHRLGQDRAVHVRVPARLQHQRAPQVIRVTPHPLTLLEHRLAARRREAVDDQAQGLAGCMRVNCFHSHHWDRTVAFGTLSRLTTLTLKSELRTLPDESLLLRHFVLPLPEGHRFPMAKYRLVRERIVGEGVLNA